MILREISVDTIDKVKKLVGAATAVGFDVEIITENFIVNAKSILGIFSVNRSAPVTMRIAAPEGSDEAAAFLDMIPDLLCAG